MYIQRLAESYVQKAVFVFEIFSFEVHKCTYKILKLKYDEIFFSLWHFCLGIRIKKKKLPVRGTVPVLVRTTLPRTTFYSVILIFNYRWFGTWSLRVFIYIWDFRTFGHGPSKRRYSSSFVNDVLNIMFRAAKIASSSEPARVILAFLSTVVFTR